MPRAILELNDTWASVTRPVAVEASRHICKLMGLEKDTDVLFQGPTQTALLNGSALENGNFDPARFKQTRRVFIQVAEEYAEDELLNMPTFKPETVSIFEDPSLELRIQTLYSKMEMTITLKFRAESQVSAERWRNLMRRKVAEGRGAGFHSLEYYYAMPDKVVMMLTDIHTLRENQAEYGEDIQTYLKKCFTPKATTLTDMVGGNPEIAIKELQTYALGRFDFDTPPKEEKGEDGAIWEVSVDYKLYYDKPISLSLYYPLLVHNQLIPQHWIRQCEAYRAESAYEAPSFSQHAFNRLKVAMGAPEYMRPISGAHYPVYDDWLPVLGQNQTSTIIRILIMVSPTDRRDVCNLTNLGPYNIHPLLLPYIRENPNYMRFSMDSPFVVELFQNDDRVDPESITIDDDLNVRTTFDMSLRFTYRLRISLVNNLTILTSDAIERLRKSGALALAILTALEPRLEEWGYLPTMASDGSLPRDEFWRAIGRIRTTNEHYRTKHEVIRMHVMSFTVDARRMADITAQELAYLEKLGSGA